MWCFSMDFRFVSDFHGSIDNFLQDSMKSRLSQGVIGYLNTPVHGGVVGDGAGAVGYGDVGGWLV